MTVFAILGLVTAVGLASDAEDARTGREQQREVAELQLRQVEELQARARALEAEKQALQEALEMARTDGALNEEMFGAIQDVERRIREITQRSSLQRDDDQTFRFGEDLVRFKQSQTAPIWRGSGSQQLRVLCDAIRRSSALGPDGAPLFHVMVEGHTDRTRCPRTPHCNLPLSADRAARFALLMKNESQCPGSSAWDIRPVGLADSHPPRSPHSDSDYRRIVVRLVPNYQRIIDGIRQKARHD